MIFIIKKKYGTHTYQYEWSYFNPVNRIKHFIKHKFLDYIIKKHPYLQCEGCGMGIKQYSIKDPNKKYNTRCKKWIVCKECVNFYDVHFSQKEIILK